LDELSLEVAAEAVEACQLDEHPDLVEASVGRAGLHHAVAPAVKDERRLADLRALEEAPVEGVLVGNDVVFARAGEASDGRVPAVGSDHEPRPQLLFSGPAVDPGADHPIPVLYQAGDLCRHPHRGAGSLGGSDEERVEHDAPDGHGSTYLAWKRRPA